MDFKLIIIFVVLVVVLNSSMLFILFWFFFRKKKDDVGSSHRLVPRTIDITEQTISAKTSLPVSKFVSEKIVSSDSNREKNRFKLLIFLSSIILALGIIYFFNFRKSTQGDLMTLNNSVNLQNKEIYRSSQEIHPGGLDLVFFADGYPAWDEFDNDIANLMIGIKQIEPWKSYGNYNIYKINPGTESQLCQVKTENERKPVLRCGVQINDYLGKLQLEKFRLIVLSRQDFQSWANVTRIDNGGIFFSVKDKIDESNGLATSYLFAHLLGHSFGLKDEEKYVIAKANGAPHNPDGPNCAPDEETAKKWWGDLAEKYPDRVGYFKTCAGSEAYIRPTQSSLMNFGEMEKFVPDYGPVSEEYLKKVLNYCFSENKTKRDADQAFFERYPEFSACLGGDL
jgi:hypothetical protein